MPLKVYTFTKTVTAAGTRERLTESNIIVPAVLIQGIQDNTNDVYLGDKEVSSSNGIEIDATDSIVINAYQMGFANEEISLRDIWIDADTNDDGVNVMCLGRT